MTIVSCEPASPVGSDGGDVAGSGYGIGDHAHWSYPSAEVRARVFSEYLEEGLAQGQRLLLVAANPYERLDEDLAAAPFSAQKLVREGRLAVLSTREAYFPGGSFDPDAGVGDYTALVQGALCAGFSGLRVAADATDVARDDAAWQEWPGYELRADVLASRLPFAALCAYDAARCDPARLARIEAVHSHVVEGTAPSPEPFRLTASADGLVLAGEVDLASAESVCELILRAGRDLEHVQVDLTSLGFVDVAGVRALIRARRALERAGSTMSLVGGPASFRRVYRILEDASPAARDEHRKGS